MNNNDDRQLTTTINNNNDEDEIKLHNETKLLRESCARNESHFLIEIASFLLIAIQVENRKAQFRSRAVDIRKLSPACEMEPFFPNGLYDPTNGLTRT